MMEIFIMHMQSDASARKHEAEQRAYERAERAEDRRQVQHMIGYLAKGCFNNERKNRKSTKKEETEE